MAAVMRMSLISMKSTRNGSKCGIATDGSRYSQVLARKLCRSCVSMDGILLTERIFMITSKQRAYLRSLAMTMEPIFQVGKSSITPEFTEAIAEALEARELIKISVLQNCMDDPKEIAQILGERTRSQVVQVVGKKITLYKEGKEGKKKIELP